LKKMLNVDHLKFLKMALILSQSINYFTMVEESFEMRAPQSNAQKWH